MLHYAGHQRVEPGYLLYATQAHQHMYQLTADLHHELE